MVATTTSTSTSTAAFASPSFPLSLPPTLTFLFFLHNSGFETEYSASYSCTEATVQPLWWDSELSQAARFHSYEMAEEDFFAHQTDESNAYLFGDSTATFDRVEHFLSVDWNGLSEVGRKVLK